jgi:hypothetical protein
LGLAASWREFKAGLRRRLVMFDVTPRDGLANALSALGCRARHDVRD